MPDVSAWGGGSSGMVDMSAMAKTVSRVDSSPIDEAMDWVSTRLDVLEKEVVALSNRLTPVLRASEPTPSAMDGSDVRASQSPLVDRIRSHGDDLEACIEMLNRVNARLVL